MMARVHVMALCATASALRPTARRTALRIGTASIIQIALPALADTDIDMDKIRALAAKKGSMDMSLPGIGKDPSKEKALVDVVLGANGAVVKLDPDEVREMERIGFLVKDSFRGKAPDFWSLRDFQPPKWYSEPVDRFYGMSVAGFTTPAADRSAANEQYAASLRKSVAEKVASVASQTPPSNWEVPVQDDGKYCGYGDYRSLCSEKTKGQKFIEEYLNPTPKNAPPPTKIQVENPIEKLSKGFSSGDKKLPSLPSLKIMSD